MRKLVIISIVIACAIAVSAAFAMNHQNMGMGCKYCGMSLEKFANSAMRITYNDGSATDVCSVHCAAIDIAINIDKAPTEITVGDFLTKEKINAETASWVIDSKNPGVMTTRAKWAFKSKEAADAYIKEKGAAAATFDQVMDAAYADMAADTKMIRQKRKMMREHKMEAPAGAPMHEHKMDAPAGAPMHEHKMDAPAGAPMH